jgi:hypothetical protein
LNDTIGNLRSEISGLKDCLKRSQEEMASASKDKNEDLRQHKSNQIDPDAVYQLGSIVGELQGAYPQLDQGVIFFTSINAGDAFNSEAEFDYINYRLKINTAEGVAPVSIAGSQSRKFINVTAKVGSKN